MPEATNEHVNQQIALGRVPCANCGRPNGRHSIGESMVCEHQLNPAAHKKPRRLCNICTPLD